MNKIKQSTNTFDTILGLFIGIPILLVVLVIISPWLLYFFLVKGPIENSKKKKFLKRNEGKRILCITTSKKYEAFSGSLLNQLKEIGIDDVVVFNGEIPNNSYDNYNWDNLVSRDKGFPLLIQMNNNGINRTALKTDFQAFFSNEIDLNQLLGSIKWKITQTD